MKPESDEVDRQTREEINRRYMRLVEILIGLAGGIVGILCAFLVQTETLKHVKGSSFLLVSLILFGVSLFIGVMAILLFVWSLEENPRFKIWRGNIWEADARQAVLFSWHNWAIGAQILTDLGVRDMKLLTNNPKKVVGLDGYGLRVVETVPIQAPAHPENIDYLETKKEKA